MQLKVQQVTLKSNRITLRKDRIFRITYVSLVPYTNGLKLTANCVPSAPKGARTPDVGVTEKWGEDLGPK
jgi:hypothetical protein